MAFVAGQAKGLLLCISTAYVCIPEGSLTMLIMSFQVWPCTTTQLNSLGNRSPSKFCTTSWQSAAREQPKLWHLCCICWYYVSERESHTTSQLQAPQGFVSAVIFLFLFAKPFTQQVPIFMLVPSSLACGSGPTGPILQETQSEPIDLQIESTSNCVSSSVWPGSTR